MDGRPHAQRTRQPPLASTSIILWCRSRPGCQTDHLSTRARLTSRVRSNRLDCSRAAPTNTKVSTIPTFN